MLSFGDGDLRTGPRRGRHPWYWHRLVPELLQRGHDVVAVNLPAGDDSAGLVQYADTVTDAGGDRTQLVLVAQSLAGFTAPLVCERLPVDLLVMLNAMVPAPGETPGQWWANTDHSAARTEQADRDGLRLKDDPELLDAFFHVIPADVRAEAIAIGSPVQSPTPFTQPWPMRTWPDVPTRFLQGQDDRLFPVEFQRRIVRDRLGITIDEMPGGHLIALSQPKELASRLETYRAENPEPPRALEQSAWVVAVAV